MTHHVIEITNERWLDLGITHPAGHRAERWLQVRTLEHPAPEWWPATSRHLIATTVAQLQAMARR